MQYSIRILISLSLSRALRRIDNMFSAGFSGGKIQELDKDSNCKLCH